MLALQVAVSSLVLAVLVACGLSDAAAGCWAAAAGLAAGVPAVVRTLAGCGRHEPHGHATQARYASACGPELYGALVDGDRAGIGVGGGRIGLALPVSPWDAVAVLLLILLGLAARTAAVGTILAITLLVPWNIRTSFRSLVAGRENAACRSSTRCCSSHWPASDGCSSAVGRTSTRRCCWAPSSPGHSWPRRCGDSSRCERATPRMRTKSPVLRDLPAGLAAAADTAARRVIMRWLVGIGLALAVWGRISYLFDVGLAPGRVTSGVRGGLGSEATAAGRMCAYPVAVIVSWAALVNGSRTKRQILNGAVLALNTVCVM